MPHNSTELGTLNNSSLVFFGKFQWQNYIYLDLPDHLAVVIILYIHQ